MGAKGCICCGSVLLILGIVVIFIGTFAIPYELPVRKTDYLVIDSTHAQQYNDWAGGYDKKTNYQMVFYYFNLTNADDVRQTAAIPNYTAVGPYIYRRYRKSLNVSFPNGGNQIDFVDFRDYQYDINASNFRSNQDIIINVNPVYFSALAQAGSEQNMLVAATGGYLTNFSNYFSTDFISLYTSLVMSDYLPAQVEKQVRNINETMKDTDKAYEYFLEQFCNATTLNTTMGNFTGLLLSQYSGVKTNISSASARALLDPQTPYSLVDTSNMTAWTWDRALTNQSYSLVLQRAFNLNQKQVEAIWHWRTSFFGPIFMYPAVIAKYDLDKIEDLGWLQWLWGHDILGGYPDAPVSIYDAFPVVEIGYYYNIELFTNPIFPSPFADWRDAQQKFNPKNGLRNLLVFQSFALAAAAGATDFSQWGLSVDQAQQLYGYSVIMGGSQVPSALTAHYGDSGGLMLTQTVDDWTFNCDTFLMELLLPEVLPCSVLINHTTYVDATINSGKDSISKINQYTEINGSPVISGIWDTDLPVSGCTELGQFAPEQNKDTVLHTFNIEFVRTMTLRYNQKTTVQKIDTQQFVLDYNNTFGLNSTFYQTIFGFSNMTTVKNAPYVGHVSSIRKLQEKGHRFEQYHSPRSRYCYRRGADHWKHIEKQKEVTGECLHASQLFVVCRNNLLTIRMQIDALKYGPRVGLIVGLSVGLLFCFIGLVMIIVGRRRSRDYVSLNDRFNPNN